MDDDDLRRGRPTVHRVYGTECAVLAGAALIPLAFRMVNRGLAALPIPAAARFVGRRELARGAGGGGMVGGQLLDLEAERTVVELGGLREIHSRKTGALIVSALRLGAIGAGADDSVVNLFGGFGEAAGLAFQIVDDVLDETSDSAVLGKTAGKDRQQSKATFPALLGIEGALSEARSAVDEAVENISGAGIDAAPFRAIGDFILSRDR